jgi:DNA-binding transcriptional MerR regulator
MKAQKHTERKSIKREVVTFTISGAVRISDMPESTVRAAERRGELATARDSAGRRFFDRAEIERYAAERVAKRQQVARQ